MCYINCGKHLIVRDNLAFCVIAEGELVVRKYSGSDLHQCPPLYMEQHWILEFFRRLVNSRFNKKNINYAPTSPVKQEKQNKKIFAFDRSLLISAAAGEHEIH